MQTTEQRFELSEIKTEQMKQVDRLNKLYELAVRKGETELALKIVHELNVVLTRLEAIKKKTPGQIQIR